MNTFRMITYGIMVASFVLVSSGCYEWNRRGDYSGYDRVGSSYDRNDRRWDEIVTAAGVTHDRIGGTRTGKEIN